MSALLALTFAGAGWRAVEGSQKFWSRSSGSELGSELDSPTACWLSFEYRAKDFA